MPTWTDFEHRHVLDPAVERGYSGWNRTEWNDWLRNRLPDFYGHRTRSLNSVIIGNPDSIKSSLHNHAMKYSTDNNLWWSDIKFPIYCLQLINHDPINKYDVYNLGGEMYFVAGLNDGDDEPVHFHGQNPVQISRGQLLKSFKNYPKIN